MDKVTQDLLDKIQPEPLASRRRFWKGFLYGEFGVGKTKVSGDCVKKRGLWIATDTGTETFYNHPELLDKIEVVPYHGLKHLTAIAEAIEEQQLKYREFDLVCADTISQIQEEYLDWLNDNFTFSGDMRVKASPTREAKQADSTLKDVEIIGLGDYNITRRNMSKPVKSLVKAPVNVMFLAHLREPNFMEQTKGNITRRPALTETVYKLIAREASFMGLMERQGPKRTIKFATEKKTVAKSRIKELDDQTIDADTLGKVLLEWSNK